MPYYYNSDTSAVTAPDIPEITIILPSRCCRAARTHSTIAIAHCAGAPSIYKPGLVHGYMRPEGKQKALA